MPGAPSDWDHIHELFSAFGSVQVRRMFGGAGVFADGVMFALLADDLIYLKADAANVAAFERENCGPFSYATKDGRRTLLSYWRLPDRLYDDPEELAQWAKAALAVARQGASPKRGASRKPAKSSGSKAMARKPRRRA